ncbi:MAG: alpha-ketoglutarate-dependent dioxygenase AlkB [Pseudomonadales bacterium]
MLREGFYPAQRAAALYRRLLEDIDWQQPDITVFGKRHKLPRLTAFYGDDGIDYSYSGLRHSALQWTPTLQRLKKDVERATGLHFNSVLANLYRDGADSNGWHADNEAELGAQPQIASLSFGASRDFHFKHRVLAEHYYSCALHSGSLLVMAGDMQNHWLHQLPKRRRVHDARINLTFRCVENP